MPEHDPERSSLSSVSDYEDADDRRPTAFIKEETPLLQLASDEDTASPVSIPSTLSVGDESIDFQITRVITRTLKSVVLIAKVCYISFMSLSTLWWI